MKRTIVVGLGNPGPEYEMTYHNVGVLAVHALADAFTKAGGEVAWKKHAGLFHYAIAGNLALVTPLVYMNESGAAVREALKKWDASPADLVIVHDESDLTIGTFQSADGKNAAGHKGVTSIIDALGTKEFKRIRIGIRDAKEVKRKKAEEFVLAHISPADRELLDGVFAAITKQLLA